MRREVWSNSVIAQEPKRLRTPVDYRANLTYELSVVRVSVVTEQLWYGHIFWFGHLWRIRLWKEYLDLPG